MPLFSPKNHQTDTTPDRKLALVLSGGGPRGAMQVGALRALMEAEIVPDFIIGTSIGAINGAFLARFGYTLETLDNMIDIWDSSARGDFTPNDFTRALLLNFLPIGNNKSYLAQARTFYAQHGITPDLRFGDLNEMKFYIVAADVSHHKIVIFGTDPNHPVLDSMLASAAIPPWLPPIQIGDSLYLDGGAVSNVPIEPAIHLGANELIVLDLFAPPPPTTHIRGAKALMSRVLTTMEARHLELEMAVAELQGVIIHHWPLQYPTNISLWDLSQTHNLIHAGYEMGKEYLREMAKKQNETITEPAEPSTLSQRWGAVARRIHELFRT